MKDERRSFVSFLKSVIRWAKLPLGRGVKWFSRTTPFVILSLFATVVLLYQLIFERNTAAEWRHPLLLRLLLFILIIVAADLILKHFFKKNYWLWVIEIFLCLGFIYYWIVT